MNWFFPDNGGGQEYGFHEAGVETFRGNINNYIAREAIQNCIDAQDNKKQPVLVTFDKILLTEKYDWLKELKQRFKSCAEYRPKDAEGKAFFDRASALISRKSIPVLKISDFNTTGVTGKDDDVDDGWYNLVRSSGSSSKFGSEGGSFGIGKSAPFAASRLRTVLYSTLTADKKYAFQGVARLATHKHKIGGRNIKAQHVGYLGNDNGASIRSSGQMPAIFRRKKTGTDIFILGYDVDSTWQDDLKVAVLENFWVALKNGRLVVKIEKEVINSKNLAEYMEEFSERKTFTAHHFYNAMVDPQSIKISGKLPTLGKVSLNLTTNGTALPKKVAMVRSTGMIIYQQRFMSLIPYAGVFYCDNTKGNAKLREMEPPRHDNWDKDRPAPGANSQTLRELNDWIRKQVQSLQTVNESQISEIPDLYKWLPDDEEGDSPLNDSEVGTEPDEGSNRKPKTAEEEISVKPITKSTESSFVNLIDEAGSGQTGGSGGGNGNGGGGGNGGGDRKGGKKGPGDAAKSSKIQIKSRVFLAEAETGTYRAVLKSNATHEVELRVYAVGDDSVPVQVSVLKAWNDDGTLLQTNKGIIQNLTLEKGNNTKLYLQVEAADRLSIEIAAYEA